MEDVVLQVSDFVGLLNQTLEYAYPRVTIEGEVSGFNISKSKWVFFDLKDKESTISCFMTIYQLKTVIEDGMKLKIVASPKLTKWGRFSVTVHSAQPVGEGSLKRAFELLKEKLDKEGLFSVDRKRPIPRYPKRIGVISSAQAAGYSDFLKIVDDRWGGLEIEFADVQVQGDVAAGQVVRAIEYFNQMESPVDVLVLIRGGGSADDLSTFNTEPVARAVAASRSPIVVGVGHEVDVSLADMAADVRAATPSNAAELVVPDKVGLMELIGYHERRMPVALMEAVARQKSRLSLSVQFLATQLLAPRARVELLEERLRLYNPRTVLGKGYSLVRSDKGGVVKSVKDLSKGDRLSLEMSDGSVGVTVDG